MWSNEAPPDFDALRRLWQYWPPKKNQRYGSDMWETINVTFRPAEEIEHVVGDSVWTPPPEWLDEPTAEERSHVRHPKALPDSTLEDSDPPTLFNTRAWPTRKDFYDKVSELKHNNADAFRGLIRQKDGDKPPPRITHSRTFYKCLDDVVQYWDTSLDEYIPSEDADTSTSTSEVAMTDLGTEDEPRKRARLAPCDDRNGAADAPPPTEEPVPPPKDPRRGPWAKRKLTPPPTGTYRGWRIDCGRHMPPELRDGIVKALLDMAIWPFHLHVDEQDRTAPRLTIAGRIGGARIAVPLARRVWRNALTRTEVRAGVKRGPALGVSCRQHVDFAAERAELGEADLARELGAMLLLAQERRREGREERRPGDGKWWDEAPRFGGLEYEVPGEYRWDAGDGEGEDEDGAAARAKKALTEKLKRRGPAPSDMTPRQRAINAYKLFLPGPPLWDPKVKYQAIGKPKGGYDEV
jgi:hypothetical protein